MLLHEVSESESYQNEDDHLHESSDPPFDGCSLPPAVEPTETYKNYFGAKLQISEPKIFTPHAARFEDDVLTSFDRQLMQTIALSLELKIPLLLEGGSGLGKTRAIERMCAETGWQCFYVNCHEFEAEMLIGTKTVREDTKSGFGWVDGTVMRSLRGDGTTEVQPRVLVLDEYNFMKGETRGRLHEILDAILSDKDHIMLTENNGEMVPIAPGLRIVCLQNPPGGKFDDREVLDEAQLTRFNYQKIHDNMPDEVMLGRALGGIGLLPESEKSPPELPELKVPLTRADLREIPGIKEVLSRYVEFAVAIARLVESYQLAEDQPQPVYFSFQRDYDRVLKYVVKHFNGDLNETFQKGLDYFYTNRFTSTDDRQKVGELISHVGYFPTNSSHRKSLETGDVETEAAAFFGSDTGIQKTAAAFLVHMRSKGVHDDVIAEGLAFDDSPEAWKLREDLMDNWADITQITRGLKGCMGDRGLQLREKLLKMGVSKSEVMKSLAGDDSPAAWEMRNRLKAEGAGPEALIESINGLDSEEAWKVREHYMMPWKVRWRYLLTEQNLEKYRGMVAQSLSGLDSDRAWKLRDRIEKEENRYYHQYLLHGLSGVDSEESWDLRERLITSNATWTYVARSLIGLNSEKAWKMRERIVLRSHEHSNLVESIGGLYTARAWNVRSEYLKTRPGECDQVVRHLSGHRYHVGIAGSGNQARARS